jgi:hypothetical protein
MYFPLSLMTTLESYAPDEHTTLYTVFPRTDGVNFWIYAEVTRMNALGKPETTLEILLPRVQIGDMSTTQRTKYQEVLVAASEELPSGDPPPQSSRERGLRRPVPTSL